MESLGDTTIALTNYGFWDIEPNQTNYVTYSYRGRKNHTWLDGEYEDIKEHHKLVKPNVALNDTDKVSEYNKKWVLNGGQYTCRGLDGIAISEYPLYVKEFAFSETEPHKFMGGNQNFAIYDKTEAEPAYILVGLTQPQFNALLFQQSDLVSKFMRWLYDQVTHPEKGEYYLHHNHASFAQTVNDKLDGLQRFTGEKYQLDSADKVNDRFANIKSLI